MAGKSKTKTAAAGGSVPQSRDQANEMIARIGYLTRASQRIETDMNEQLASIKNQFGLQAEPLAMEIKALTNGLAVWCEANRLDLVGKGGGKTAVFAAGEVSWRSRPPRVTLRDKVATVIARIRALGLADRFLRVTEEIDKEALRADPEAARAIDGVRIGSAGEDFIVRPFEADLEGGAS